MAINPGTRLGPYEIVSAIGAGGMGEVYKARDTRLERTVAIKVIPPALAADPEFRQRFDREAKAISQLTHPNICTLHDVGEDQGVAFLVMEYLEGQTLAARLTSAPRGLPIAEALAVAGQIAAALDAAHRQGIVHRDLKPGNVMLAKSGAKLLDFGLAKTGLPTGSGAMSAQLTTLASAPAEAPLTARGTILGTFQYMAPEQIEGGAADARADIWAFGCVVYEMVTGRRAFEGKSQISLIGAILEREPTPVSELQPVTPPALARLIRTCLAKNPDDRFQSAHDLALQLRWIDEGGSAAGLPAPVVAGRKRRDRAIWVGVAAAAAIAGAAVAWSLKPAPPVERVVSRFAFTLPEGQNLTRTGRHSIAISPDGRKIVYVANQQLYLRTIDQLEAQPIRGTQEDPLDPVFSPDGQWVAYFAPSVAGASAASTSMALRKVAIAGGAPVTLTPSSFPYGVSWRNGTIAFGVHPSTGSKEAGIKAVSDSGGSPRMLVTIDPKAEFAAQPELSADGKHVLFALIPVATAGTSDVGQIVLQTIEGGARQVLVTGGTSPHVLSTGHLVYVHDNTLFAVPFDAARGAVTGGPVPVAEGVLETLASWSGQFAIASNGTLVFRPGTTTGAAQRTLVWIDRQGHEQSIAAPTKSYQYPRLSPDGTKISASASDDEHDIWIFDLEKGTLTRLTFGPASEVYSPWMPDGRSVIYSSGDSEQSSQRDLFRKAADGTGTAQPLTTGKSGGAPMSISPDGKFMVTRTGTGGEPNDLMLTALDGSGKTQPLLADPKFNERNGEISPDGRWIAYDSNESGRQEVFVRPFPNVDGGRWQISADGGAFPVWARSGRELFFVSISNPPALMSVTLQPGAVFTYGKPERLFDVTPYYSATGRSLDVALDGKRFLAIKSAGSAATVRPSFVVVSNWFDELRARVK